jgi:hypothetical protein
VSQDFNAVANQRTRLQVEVFQFDGPNAGLAKLDLDDIQGAAASEILVRMAELGQARLLHRVDTRAEFGRQISVKNGNRVPVVQDVAKQKDGQISRSVNYQQTGLSLNMSGLWVEDDEEETWADLSCDLEWSSIAETNIEASEGVSLPAFGQFEFNQSLRIKSGEPVMFLASHQPLAGDEEDRITAGIIRLTVFQLNARPGAGKPQQ